MADAPVGAARQAGRAVGLVVHSGRPPAVRAAAAGAELLLQQGATVFASTGDGWDGGGAAIRWCSPDDLADLADVIMVFGGDGTFLRAAHLARGTGVPLVGVNLGRLGFLSEVETDELPDAVAAIVAGRFTVEERMTLHASVHAPDGTVVGTCWALNEASIERTEPRRLVVLEVAIGGTPFASIPADALICATPTGSTAYAFSAGGPITSPSVEAILVVPVAPHTLFARTVVINAAEPLEVRPVGTDNPCVVTCDGRPSLPVPPGGAVVVTRGQHPVRMARLEPFDFYQRVRDKFSLR